MSTKFIDVSSYQGNSVGYFQARKASGIANAIVKATESDNYVNNAVQFANAIKVFKTVGLYHFLHLKPVTEANIFLKTIRSWGATKDTLVVVDVEYAGLIGNDVTGLTNKWIDTVYDAGYHNIMVYASENWFQNYLSINKLNHHPKIWVAKYSSATPKVARYDAWQFTDHFQGMLLDCSYNVNNIFDDNTKPEYWKDGSLFEMISDCHVYHTLDFKQKPRRTFFPKRTRVYGKPVKNGSIYSIKTAMGYISANKQFVNKIK